MFAEEMTPPVPQPPTSEFPGSAAPGARRMSALFQHAWADNVLVTVIVVAGALYYSLVASRVTAPGFPLDDSWIHLQFARNVAAGHGVSFNPGVWSSGSTSPLWTLLLAITGMLPASPVVAAKVLGTTLTLVTALAAGGIVRHLTASRFAALTASLTVALSPRMTWASVSGMEVSLYCALAAMTVLTYLRASARNRGLLWAVFAALTGTARPETFIMFPILFVHWLWTAYSQRDAVRLRNSVAPALAFAAVFATWVGFNLAVGGAPLPMTFYAKNEGKGLLIALLEGNVSTVTRKLFVDSNEFANILLKWCQEQSMFLSFLVLVGLLVVAGALRTSGTRPTDGIVIIAILLISPAFKGVFAPLPKMLVHDGRYVLHLLLLFFLTAAIGAGYLWEHTRKRWVVAVFVGLALIRLASQDVKFATTYAAQVRNINDLQLATAGWLQANTTDDARIATNDIGAIAYFGKRFVLDIEGLVTPDAIPFKRRNDPAGYLAHARPDLVIIFPRWYPELAGRTDLLQEIDRITSLPQVVAGGESLVIYRTPWTREEAVHAAGVMPADVRSTR